jgi:hypothetical protein
MASPLSVWRRTFFLLTGGPRRLARGQIFLVGDWMGVCWGDSLHLPTVERPTNPWVETLCWAAETNQQADLSRMTS